ncbi:MAG TPA: OB-fold domain-containing protein [Acidisphaera sp.]|nr:OB-fold domain-containing protein [Acidisphaera sp.]
MTDWTEGAPAIVFQHCGACGATWYFAREFCPECGAPDPQCRVASGRGRVYAITTVTRAPSPELRELAPYRIALVDMEEGFRAMTHAADDVAIDDPVQTRFVPFGTLTIPFCERREIAA